MKLLFLALLLTACSSSAQVIPEQKVYLPLVANDSQPCRDVGISVMLHYIHEDRTEGPFQVVDCLQHSEQWEVPLERGEIVEVDGGNFQHWGIAQQGERWLRVLIWHESIRPYSLNLILVDE